MNASELADRYGITYGSIRASAWPYRSYWRYWCQTGHAHRLESRAIACCEALQRKLKDQT